MADYEPPDIGSVKARREVTFTTIGLPGRHATFVHEKALWIAAPAVKTRNLFNRAARLAQQARRAHAQLLAIVTRHPNLYPELAPTLELLDRMSAGTPFGAVLDAEIATVEARRAASRKRRDPKFTH